MALTALIGPATKLIGKFVRDKDKQAQLAHEISTMAEKHSQELMMQQLEVNKAEDISILQQSTHSCSILKVCKM